MLTVITERPILLIKPQLAAEQAVRHLLALPDYSAQQQFLCAQRASFDVSAVTLLKAEADRLLRTATDAVLRIGALLRELGGLQAAPAVIALGLVVEANAYSAGGQGEYARAVAAYTQAVALYTAQGQWVEAGRALVGKLFALTALGRYAEALAAGEQASQLFTAHPAPAELAGLQWNLAILHGQQGNDRAALHHFDQVQAYYQTLGAAGEHFSPLVEQNRAVVLRNLGEFAASIAASQQAQVAFLSQGQPIEAARAQQNLAHTYLILGRYQDALLLLEAAGRTFAEDGRRADAMVVELHLTSCLLHLRQFAAVLNKCQGLRSHFTATGQQPELGQTLLNGVMAYAGLHQFEHALGLLAEVRAIFTPATSLVWYTMAELERAAILFHRALPATDETDRRAELAASLAISETCIPIFAQQGLIVHEARAALLSARSAHRLGDNPHTQRRLAQALAIGEKNDLATLVYQVYALAGDLCRQRADISGASDAYAQAIAALERLCSQTMVEFRTTFLEDKGLLYEEMVDLCLALHDADQGFAYAERAKSRALLALVATPAQRRADDEASQALLAQLEELRAAWNNLHRQLTLPTEQPQPTRSLTFFDEEAGGTTRHGGLLTSQQRQLFALEAQITDLWRQLQIHRTVTPTAMGAPTLPLPFGAMAATTPAYDRQALPADSVLVEYFALRGRFVAFVVTAQAVRAVRLSVTERQVAQSLRLLELNWRAVLCAEERSVAALLQNAQGLLQQLYTALWAPVVEAVGTAQQLCIVPHGVLHHLPFHALYDGARYLLARYTISYLPNADLLPHCKPAVPAQGGALVIGHSYGGRLPYAVCEAHAVVTQIGGNLLLEQDATRTALQTQMANCAIIHFATHGHFRADNHLFSGLALEDGWLTTLDISNLRLQAALVTLSACQTGRHIVGGGDELLGLMRAFLGAGASSLVATLWAVEDGSTAQLMADFYGQLAAGLGKGAALRQAQLGLLTGTNSNERYRHPYYWAPFFLVGDTGPL